MHDARLGDNFHTTTAQRLGVSRQRLRRADLVAPHFGVRATHTADDLVGRCHAFLPAMSSRMAFSHATAALIHGLPLPPRLARDPTLHVSSLAPTRASRHTGVRGHQIRLRLDEIDVVAGLPVVGPIETWCQLAGALDEADLTVCGDALVRRKSPLTTIAEMERAVQRCVDRPGVPVLRGAMGRVRPNTDSPMETVIRLALVDAGLPEPLVNYGIADSGGRIVAHGDLVYPEARVVVEYDGDHHRTEDRQYFIDIDRLWRIQSLGWTVVRINRTHLADGAAEAVSRTRFALRCG
ncbi:hypothetical protein A0130_02850 [Leifsonia xyli]|uniref:hypothetical protein n=1 Tax=Leifsonia xyli TaxID=1575 RepID=UPI0007CD9EB9|nr:hypothetical protein A0130_02850 [Leifsonia xyli]